MTELELRDAIIEHGRKFILGVEIWYFPNTVPMREDLVNICITELRTHLEKLFDERDEEEKRYNEKSEKN